MATCWSTGSRLSTRCHQPRGTKMSSPAPTTPLPVSHPVDQTSSGRRGVTGGRPEIGAETPRGSSSGIRHAERPHRPPRPRPPASGRHLAPDAFDPPCTLERADPFQVPLHEDLNTTARAGSACHDGRRRPAHAAQGGLRAAARGAGGRQRHGPHAARSHPRQAHGARHDVRLPLRPGPGGGHRLDQVRDVPLPDRPPFPRSRRRLRAAPGTHHQGPAADGGRAGG